MGTSTPIATRIIWIYVFVLVIIIAALSFLAATHALVLGGSNGGAGAPPNGLLELSGPPNQLVAVLHLRVTTPVSGQVLITQSHIAAANIELVQAHGPKAFDTKSGWSVKLGLQGGLTKTISVHDPRYTEQFPTLPGTPISAQFQTDVQIDIAVPLYENGQALPIQTLSLFDDGNRLLLSAQAKYGLDAILQRFEVLAMATANDEANGAGIQPPSRQLPTENAASQGQ